MTRVKLTEQRYEFIFDAGWVAEQYDEWRHYRENLQQVRIKAGKDELSGCDFVATDGFRAYLVEVKDYAYPGTTLPEELPGKIALKALDTLAGLVSAREKGGPESTIAARVLKSRSIHLVVSIGLPDRRRKLMSPELFLANVKQKLKESTKQVLPHLHVHLLGERGKAWDTRRVA
ncbi:hypothetical protein ACXR2T_11140 [Leucobacter sp. HY1910]